MMWKERFCEGLLVAPAASATSKGGSASSAGTDDVPKITTSVAGAAAVPMGGPVSAVRVVSPAVTLIVVIPATSAGACFISEVNGRDDRPVAPVPVPFALDFLGDGRVAGSHEVTIPGTLLYLFLLAATHADQLGDQLGSGGCGKETEEVGVVRSAFITIWGSEVAEPVVSVSGDEVPNLDRPHHPVVLSGALRDGSPSLAVLLQGFPAILGGDLSDQPLRHAEQWSLDGGEDLDLTSMLVFEVGLMLLLTGVIQDDSAGIDRRRYRLVHIRLVLHVAARGHEG